MAQIRSETAGTVFRIESPVGTEVGIDDVILIIEAMKMEIPVTSPIAGTVTGLAVAEGEMVEEDQPVATVE